MSSLHLGLLNGTFLNFVKLEALRISLRLHFYNYMGIKFTMPQIVWEYGVKRRRRTQEAT